jgi:hypothetical protein
LPKPAERSPASASRAGSMPCAWHFWLRGSSLATR